MTPTIRALDPAAGPTGGGNHVRVNGDGFSQRVVVRFDGALAGVALALAHGGQMIADVIAPPHAAGAIEVTVQNLDATGVPVDAPARLSSAYAYERPELVTDSDLARLVRTIVQALRRDVLDDTHLAVNVDYDDSPQDPTRITALARVPSLTVSGPAFTRSARYGDCNPIDAVMNGQLVRRRPRLIADLFFALTGASRSVPEILNLLSATARFVARNPWLSMPRDPDRPDLGLVRWDLDNQGEWRTQIPGDAGVHTFTGGFAIRGFALDEGLPVERVNAADSVSIDAGARSAQGAVP